MPKGRWENQNTDPTGIPGVDRGRTGGAGGSVVRVRRACPGRPLQLEGKVENHRHAVALPLHGPQLLPGARNADEEGGRGPHVPGDGRRAGGSGLEGGRFGDAARPQDPLRETR